MYHSIQKQRPDRTFSTAQRQSDAAVLQNKNRAATQLRAMQTALAQEQNTPIQKQENKTGMPDHLKSNLESMSGFDMSDVRVHYNSDKPAQLQAHAYAQGTDIHIAPGQERHLPHEAWHVVQQKQGRVKPTMQLKGKVNINDDKGLEKEADVMGGKAISSSDSTSKQSGSTLQCKRKSIVQRNADAESHYFSKDKFKKSSSGHAGPSHTEKLKTRFDAVMDELFSSYSNLMVSHGNPIVVSSKNALLHFSIDPVNIKASHFTFESFVA